MTNFQYYLELLKKSFYCDPWIKDKGLEGYCHETMKEMEEVIEAIEKNDMENLKEELGDVLSDVILSIMLAEHEKQISFDDVIKEAVEKIKRRRPYVLKDRQVTMDEAVKIWFEVKAKEKAMKKKKR